MPQAPVRPVTMENTIEDIPEYDTGALNVFIYCVAMMEGVFCYLFSALGSLPRALTYRAAHDEAHEVYDEQVHETERIHLGTDGRVFGLEKVVKKEAHETGRIRLGTVDDGRVFGLEKVAEEEEEDWESKGDGDDHYDSDGGSFDDDRASTTSSITPSRAIDSTISSGALPSSSNPDMPMAQPAKNRKKNSFVAFFESIGHPKSKRSKKTGKGTATIEFGLVTKPKQISDSESAKRARKLLFRRRGARKESSDLSCEEGEESKFEDATRVMARSLFVVTDKVTNARWVQRTIAIVEEERKKRGEGSRRALDSSH